MHQIASQRIFISKHFRGSMPPDPPRKLVAFAHSGPLPKTNPGNLPISNQAKKARSFVTASNNVGTRVRVLPLYLFTDVLPTTRLANNLFPTS